MTITADGLVGLQRRLRDAERAHAVAVAQLYETRKAIERAATERMEQYGCDSNAALEALIVVRQAEADRLAAEAEAALTRAERWVPDAET